MSLLVCMSIHVDRQTTKRNKNIFGLEFFIFTYHSQNYDTYKPKTNAEINKEKSIWRTDFSDFFLMFLILFFHKLL